MIARITNFANREDKLIAFDARRVDFITLDKVKRNENYVSEYPNLKDDFKKLYSIKKVCPKK